jgi:hypothetical protein
LVYKAPQMVILPFSTEFKVSEAYKIKSAGLPKFCIMHYAFYIITTLLIANYIRLCCRRVFLPGNKDFIHAEAVDFSD